SQPTGVEMQSTPHRAGSSFPVSGPARSSHGPADHERTARPGGLTRDAAGLRMSRLMGHRSGALNREVAVAEAPAALPLARRWWGKPALLLLTIALLTFSFAPFRQFYLAWIALVPWLIVLRHCRSARAAFLWSWLGGEVFFTANMWWLVFVTGPGMAALMLCLGLYWG